MGNYENLKQSITEVIRTNGNQEITGAVLQSTLLTIISTVGANATFAGIATPATNPGTPDGPVFWLASESGTYSNFGSVELQDGLSVLMWNGSWGSQQIFDVDDEPTAGSDNLVKSVGILKSLIDFSKITFYHGVVINDGSICITPNSLNRLCSTYIKGPFEYQLAEGYSVTSCNKYDENGKFIQYYAANNVLNACKNNGYNQYIVIGIKKQDDSDINEDYKDIITITKLDFPNVIGLINTNKELFDNTTQTLSRSISENTNIPIYGSSGDVIEVTISSVCSISLMYTSGQYLYKVNAPIGTYVISLTDNLNAVRFTDLSGITNVTIKKVSYANEIPSFRVGTYLTGKVSIIGDSISSFNGYVVNGYPTFYPKLDVLDVDDIWWKMLLNRSNSKLEVNASYSGSCATNIRTGYPSFYDRVSILGNPDYIFIALGTNDSSEQAPLGEYEYDKDINELSESEFRPAYIKGIKGLQANYPNAKIILIAFKMSGTFFSSIQDIANYYGLSFIDCRNFKLGDNLHPNSEGMIGAASLIHDTLLFKTTNEKIDEAVNLAKTAADYTISRLIHENTNIPYAASKDNILYVTTDNTCSISLLYETEQVLIHRNAPAGQYTITVADNLKGIRITDINNGAVNVIIKKKTYEEYIKQEHDTVFHGNSVLATVTESTNISFQAYKDDKISIAIDRVCSISLMYYSGQAIYRLNAPVGVYEIALTDRLKEVRITDTTYCNVRISLLSNKLAETDPLSVGNFRYGVFDYMRNSDSNYYTKIGIMLDSAYNTKNTVLKRITTSDIVYAHMPNMIINNGIVYLTYLQNTGSEGEGTYSTTSSVILAIFTIDRFSANDFDPTSDVEVYEIGRLGDTFAGYTAESIFKDNSMCLVNNIMYIPFMFITAEEHIARMFTAKFNITTKAFETGIASSIIYKGETLDFNINTINTIYVKEGYKVVKTQDNIIELVSKWSEYNNEFYATLVCSGGKGNNGMVVKTSDFETFYFVSCIPFNNNGEAEIASIIYDNKLYVACRQNYGIPYLLLGYYNLSDSYWSAATEIPDGNSRPYFFVRNNKLYLMNTIQEYDRRYFNISQIKTQHYSGTHIPISKVVSTYENVGHYYAVQDDYIVCIKNTISFGLLSFRESDSYNVANRMLDIFENN